MSRSAVIEDGATSWRRALIASQSQALTDLAETGAAELVFVRASRSAEAERFFDESLKSAANEGYVTARVTVLEGRAFDALDLLVRAVIRALQAPETSALKRESLRGNTGLLALLDVFAARHGAESALRFDQGLILHGAGGDLVTLARAYLGPGARRREAQRIEAWVAGTELARSDESSAHAALSARTARRALREVSQLVRVLGWRGTLVIFERAEIIAKFPPGRRDDALTVLRELTDDTDSGRGLVATRLVVSASDLFFDDARGIALLPPLASRVLPVPGVSTSLPGGPHNPLVTLDAKGDLGNVTAPAKTATTDAPRLSALRALQRAAHGLPPTDPVTAMSVGHEAIDATLTRLFEHAAMQSSVFALLVGGYGTGKSHLLSHLAARALHDRRPVFRLSLERMDNDLGSPQRHLRRMLDQAVLPLPGGPSPLELLTHWSRTPVTLSRLVARVHALAEAESVASPAAKKLRLQLQRTRNFGPVIESYLGAAEIVEKPSNPNYRHDAYHRMMLWCTLLEEIEGCQGPVVIIDEAENLFRGGNTRATRRTALRSLSFYCGGALPSACVVMAVTPDALDALRAEAGELLNDVSEQRTVLAVEDAAMFRRRLVMLKPLEVPALTRGMLSTLAFRVREVHQSVRGPVDDVGWSSFVFDLVASDLAPRGVLRAVVERLEGAWWRRRLSATGL